MGIRGEDGLSLLTQSKDVASFTIIGGIGNKGMNGSLADSLADSSHSPLVSYEWEFNENEIYTFNSNFNKKINV
jgi:hypothetical protein